MAIRIAKHFRDNVVGYLALVVSLSGGAAYATTYVVSSNSQLGPSTVSGHAPPAGKHANIIGGSVNGSDLASNAVTGAKVANGSLRGADIGANSVTGAQVDESSLDPNVLQRRITASCFPGTAITEVTGDGGIQCNTTLPGGPAVNVWATTQTDATSPQGVFLPAPEERFDLTGMHDASAPGDCSKEPNNCEVVVAQGGIYTIHAQTSWEFNPSFCAVGEEYPMQTYIYILSASGSVRDTIGKVESVACDAADGTTVDQDVVGLRSLEAGDRLEVWVDGPSLGPHVRITELSAALVAL